MYKISYFRSTLLFIVIATCALPGAGCEAVLGAEFDDFIRISDADGTSDDADASRGGSGSIDASVESAGGSGGGAGGAGGVKDGGDTANGGGGTGGHAGIADGGGRAGSGGAAGTVSIADAGGRSGGPAGDASLLDADVSDDAGSDAIVVDDVGSHDTSDGDAPIDVPAPPRDGSTGGGVCVPNEVRSIGTCGNCGLFLQACNAQGVWDPPFCRQEPGACAPGSIERRTCPSGGTQVATCNATCTWSLGECVAPPCTIGQTETIACGLCGTQSRSCVATEGGLAWGPFSACANQGVCAPGTRDTATCGKCGSYARVCNAKCTYDPWGACQNERECYPGTSETRTCTIVPIILNGKQTRTCDMSCNWGDYSKCK